MYTKKDYDKKLLPGMIMIGANWCPHCTELKPIWKQLKKRAKDHTIAAVDAMKNRELIHMMGIAGYPTIFIVMNNGNLKEYSGPRTVDALIKKLPKLRKKKVKK